MKLIDMAPAHMEDLYRACCAAENIQDEVTLFDFKGIMLQREGWSVISGDTIIGCVSYSNYAPGLDIILHSFVHPAFHGKWLSRSMLRTIFEKPFLHLGLDRVTGYSISGETDKAGRLLEHLGFTQEGVIRKGASKHGRKFDLVLYGMLREECRWL